MNPTLQCSPSEYKCSGIKEIVTTFDSDEKRNIRAGWEAHYPINGLPIITAGLPKTLNREKKWCGKIDATDWIRTIRTTHYWRTCMNLVWMHLCAGRWCLRCVSAKLNICNWNADRARDLRRRFIWYAVFFGRNGSRSLFCFITDLVINNSSLSSMRGYPNDPLYYNGTKGTEFTSSWPQPAMTSWLKLQGS